MKRLTAILLLAMSLVVPGQVLASQPPQALVEETSQLMITKLREEKEAIKAEPGRIYELVDQIILPHFDFEYMSQLVLAKHWRKASAGQRSAFTDEFKMLLIRTYATSLNEYADQELTYLPFRASKKKDKAVVRTEVEQPGSFPIPIDYQLRNKNDSWKVFDVVIDSVSLVKNYRTSFSKEIRKEGLDQLIKTLAARNKQATGE